MADLDDAVLAVTDHVPAADADAWFTALHTAAEAADEWADFTDALEREARAAGLPDAAVRAFVEVVGAQSDPAGTVSLLRATDRGRLVEDYRRSVGEAGDSRDEPVGSDPRALSWVAEAQRAELEAGLGEGWAEVLLREMDQLWPGWEDADEGTRSQFVADWAPTIVAQGASAVGSGADAGGPDAGPRALGWLAEAQRAELEAGLGGSWAEVLLREMDERWPGWEAADEATRTQFVSDWAAVIIAAHPAAAPDVAPAGATVAPADAAEPDAVDPDAVDPDAVESDAVGPRELGWVTEAQRAELEAGLGGGWGEVLLREMDQRWPGWEAADDGTRTQFVSDWAAVIIAAGSDVEPDAAEPAGPRALEWLTQPQRAELEAGLGGGWAEVLLREMDQQWPGWEAADDGTRTQFVTDWTSVIIATNPAPPSADASGSTAQTAEEIEQAVAEAVSGQVPRPDGITDEEYRRVVAEAMRETVDGR